MITRAGPLEREVLSPSCGFISGGNGMLVKALAWLALGLTASVVSLDASAQTTLNSVKQKGLLTCGSNTNFLGFGAQDPQGNWSGLDIDFCRAMAAAIFDDPSKVRFVPLTARDRFPALQSAEVDVLARNSTATMSRETQLGLDFPAINYFDGQSFMVRKSLAVSSAKELNGKSICADQGTTTELNLADYFRANSLTYQPILFPSTTEAKEAYEAGRCDALTTDTSNLYDGRLKTSNPDDHVVLSEVISKEPLGPAVRHGDNQWADIVKFVHTAMLNAEELGVTKANIDQMKGSNNPEIKRLLGIEGKLGEALGLTNEWAYRIIKHVGNYGEVFDRNVGAGSKLKIKRGQNALWTNGGLQYGIPIR
jgi:general L-amino acid transport system substrate-binding protein